MGIHTLDGDTTPYIYVSSLVLVYLTPYIHVCILQGKRPATPYIYVSSLVLVYLTPYIHVCIFQGLMIQSLGLAHSWIKTVSMYHVVRECIHRSNGRTIETIRQ